MLKQTVRDAIAGYLTQLKNQKLLIAVSGGSDSMALLYLCSTLPSLNFEVATVDHGLRPEAADEALFVAEQCAALKVKHSTLSWRPDGATSQSARLARYGLLTQHAQNVSAGGIVLGHTQDDQAETLLMRAQRLKEDSSTRGLSGMPEIASYGAIKLLRPLLDAGREELRDFLRGQDLAWLDDPSNEKLEYERVRARKTLRNDQTLPPIEQIARLAQLSGRHRRWLAPHISEHIRNFVSFDDSNLSLAHTNNIPDPVITEIFLVLILASGGGEFRVSDRKVRDIVEAYQSNRNTRKAVGNCLISVANQSVYFSKEVRKNNSFQNTSENIVKNCETKSNKITRPGEPFVDVLEYFRPASDDSIRDALLHLHDPTAR